MDAAPIYSSCLISVRVPLFCEWQHPCERPFRDSATLPVTTVPVVKYPRAGFPSFRCVLDIAGKMAVVRHDLFIRRSGFCPTHRGFSSYRRWEIPLHGILYPAQTTRRTQSISGALPEFYRQLFEDWRRVWVLLDALPQRRLRTEHSLLKCWDSSLPPGTWI